MSQPPEWFTLPPRQCGQPGPVHAFGKTELTRAKTDKADARLIARYCQMHRPAPWVPPAEEIITLQAIDKTAWQAAVRLHIMDRYT